jgi:hypothetical protein
MRVQGAGGVLKRSTRADCKSAGYAYVGSNPTPSTITVGTKKIFERDALGVYPGGPRVLWMFVCSYVGCGASSERIRLDMEGLKGIANRAGVVQGQNLSLPS